MTSAFFYPLVKSLNNACNFLSFNYTYLIEGSYNLKGSQKQIAFMNLYQPIHSRFERFCRARVYGEMEHGDLINETLLLAFEKFDKLKDQKAFLSFLFGIAIRILSNQKKKKRPQTGLDSFQDSISVQSKGDRLTDVGILHEALAQLAVDQRESLILFEISGFSIKEIAELHGVGESAVKQRLRRGRLRLTEILNTNDLNMKKKEIYHG